MTHDQLVEIVARTIDPEVWVWVDKTVAPFAENRGSGSGDAGESYGRAWRHGVRTAEEAMDWCINKSNLAMGERLQFSLAHASTALSAIYEAMKEPTPEMYAAACDPQTIFKHTTPDERGGKIPLLPAMHYRAMLDASPLNGGRDE